MKNFSQYKEIGRTTNTVVYIAESDPDILIIVPREGTMDNAEDARENVAYFHSYARSLGEPCASVVIMVNMLSQDAEAHRAYQEIDTDLFYGGGLVVEDGLSRAGLQRLCLATGMDDYVSEPIQVKESQAVLEHC